MSEIQNELSEYKEIHCIYCHTELCLNLAERRGTKDIHCPSCKKIYSIKDVNLFFSRLSPITEGKCPNCYTDLVFDLEDRTGNNLIKCPICKDSFYIDEAKINHKISKTEDGRRDSGEKTYSALSYYFPDIKIDYDIHGTDYYIKDDRFNKDVFLTWFIILNLSLPLIITIANRPTGIGSWNYDFSDWCIDFWGSFLSFLIPSILVAWIIGKSIKGERKLSEAEIARYKNEYNARK